MFPGDEKWGLWGRIAKLYAECRELADEVDGQRCFRLERIERLQRLDPATHEWWLEWEGRVGGFFYNGRVLTGRRYALVDNAEGGVFTLLAEAKVRLLRARKASLCA